ncbi:MAG: O-antigen ligase family protein [Gammaproteobacteria bacterium]|nr:O-antigen ligase family protein [Gammaproteobacteria bacterium]MDH5692220.1 O-antigen ligase family protein [Gammaproteobacteria bacterium]
MEIWTFILLVGVSVYLLKENSFLPQSIYKIKKIMLFFKMWVGYLILRTAVDLFSSQWSDFYAQNQKLVKQSLEIDPEMGSKVSEQLELLSRYFDYGSGIQELILVFCYVGLFYLTTILCSDKRRIQTLFVVISAVGIMEACLGLLNSAVFFFSNGASDFRSIATGTFVNRNHYSAFLNISAFCILAILLDVGLQERRSSHRWLAKNYLITRIMDWRIQFVVGFCLILFAQLLTQSRTGLVVMAITSIIGVLIIGARRKIWAEYAHVIFTFAGIFAVMFVSIGIKIISTRFTAESFELDSRIEIWPVIFKIFQDNWLFGTGLRSLGQVYPLYNDGVVTHFVSHAHNDYLQTTVEQGLIGAGLLLVIIVLVYMRGIRTLLTSNKSGELAYTFGAFMVVTSMLLHGLTDFNFRIPSNAAYFFVMLAVLAQYSWARKPRKKKKSSELYEPGAINNLDVKLRRKLLS